MSRSSNPYSRISASTCSGVQPSASRSNSQTGFVTVAVGGGAVEPQRGVGLCEVVVGAHLDRPVAEVLDAIKLREPELPVIIFSGHGNIEIAVAARKWPVKL